MTRDRARPADVVLDLLRGAGHIGRSAAHLVEVGGLFGFTDNTVRVTLSRLQARGVIESPKRGEYRLAETADPINEFVERWRLGEARVRPWNGRTWVVVHEPEALDKGIWALEACGLRRTEDGLFVRPDNLALNGESLRELLLSIGLPRTALVLEGAPVGHQHDDWRGLWNGDALNDEYADMIRRLEESNDRLGLLELDSARIETFRLGGAAIHLLAKDPLLPEDWVDVAVRERLWATMMDYDTAGKAIWSVSKRDSNRDRETSLPIPRLVNEG